VYCSAKYEQWKKTLPKCYQTIRHQQCLAQEKHTEYWKNFTTDLMLQKNKVKKLVLFSEA
jgi:hypothetical protein